MRILLLSAALIGAGLVTAGPTIAQTAQEKIKPVQTAQRDTAKSTDDNATTGLSSAKKEHEEMGASPNSQTGSTRSATTGAMSSHNDATTGLSSAKKEHEEAGGSNK